MGRSSLRAYNVTAQLHGRKFVAVFRMATGAKVCRSLKTSDKTRADHMCLALAELWRRGVTSSSEVPHDLLLPEGVSALYFGISGSSSSGVQRTGRMADEERDVDSEVDAELKKIPGGYTVIMRGFVEELVRIRRENSRLREDLALARRDLKVEREGRESLEKSIIGRAAAAGGRIPAMEKAFDLFKAHMKANTSRKNAAMVTAIGRTFIDSLPPARKSFVDITVADVSAFIDSYVAKGAHHKKAGRRDAIRRRIGRMLNWSAQAYEYPTQMSAVDAVGAGDLDRERGAIVWHSIDLRGGRG